jgi:hypothetical protein
MNVAAAAGQAVEKVNGIPAPIALVMTIVGCIAAVAWVVFIVMKDARYDKQSVKK